MNTDDARLVRALELQRLVATTASKAVLPDLIKRLVMASCPDLSECWIQDGDHINRAGLDGFVETAAGFSRFVPGGRSYWEFSNHERVGRKATDDLAKRSKEASAEERSRTTFVFVTLRSWDDSNPNDWIAKHSHLGWKSLKVLDASQLSDWLQELPAIARTLMATIDPNRKPAGWRTVSEHWETLRCARRHADPEIPPALFLERRARAIEVTKAVFAGKSDRVCLSAENAGDVKDFVAALVAIEEPETRENWSNRCVLVDSSEGWASIPNGGPRLVLVASEDVGLDPQHEHLRRAATHGGHAVILQVRSAPGGSDVVFELRRPLTDQVERALTDAGYSGQRVRELLGGGFSSLAVLKRRLEGLPDSPDYARGPANRAFALAGLIGGWEETFLADLEVVGRILGESFEQWRRNAREELSKAGCPLLGRNRRWENVARGEAWDALGACILDDDLERFEHEALAVLAEANPELEVPSGERWRSAMYGKARRYSPPLREGMAETLALLGSRSEGILRSATPRKPWRVAISVVRTLLRDADWERWASLNDVLPLLAEAAPSELLDALERALVDVQSSFATRVFGQESGGPLGRSYMSGLLQALETLAWHPDYLSRVALILAALASVDPGGQWAQRPARCLTEILLPWYPQTASPIEQRVSAIKAVAKRYPDVAWNLVLSLLPDQLGYSTGCRKPRWRTELMGSWEEGVSRAACADQVERYFALATELSARQPKRIAALVHDLHRMTPNMRTVVLRELVPGLKGGPGAELLEVWEALVALAAKHRACAKATWVMPEAEIVAVEKSAAEVEPRDPVLRHRRLFGHQDLLPRAEVSFDEHEKWLGACRQDALSEILFDGGVDRVVAMIAEVKRPFLLGHALGSLDRTDHDIQILPHLLAGTEAVKQDFVVGFARARWEKASWNWVDGLDMSQWSAAAKAGLFALLPFTPETWRRVEKRLGAEAAAYWRSVEPNPWVSTAHDEGAERLLDHGRPFKALTLCGGAVKLERPLSAGIAIRVLRTCAANPPPTESFDAEAAREVITWLQQQRGVNEDDLFEIEWTYLALLRHLDDAGPKTIEARLAREPELFCEAIRMAYRSADEEDERKVVPSEEERKRATSAGSVLHGMRVLPGRRDDGSFDGTVFESWLAKVRDVAAKTGHMRPALAQVGRVCAASSLPENWLESMPDVAEALDTPDAEAMRNSFSCQLYNNRGVHSFTGGREERELARGFRDKAKLAESKGWIRLATTLRERAAGYELEAENAAREAEDRS